MKGEGYDSFCYPGTDFAINEASVRLSKIGVVKAIIHRKVEGTVKTCTVKRQGKKWFACLAVETQAAPLPENSRAIGIDVGIEKFAALSDGTYIQNPRFFRKDEKALAKAQRKTERYKNGLRNERKPRKWFLVSMSGSKIVGIISFTRKAAKSSASSASLLSKT